jgi:myo-inositol-hexaphosphate 3-phosphohydrolase
MLVAVACAMAATQAGQPASVTVKPVLILKNDDMRDQDDMCFWKHPKDPTQSVVITSDKYRNKLFVYDLSGKVLQELRAYKPGNIDYRTGFPLAGEKIDIIVHNQRSAPKYMLKAYKVDPATRNVTCIDNGDIRTGENYGGCLYHSSKTGKFYFFTTAKGKIVEQTELFDDGKGKVAGKKVRAWKVGFCEGAVADDQAGIVYVAEERRGIWAFNAEPDAATEGKLVAKVGENGLQPDIEGLTIMPTGDKDGYLIASSQGNNTFKVYQRAAPNAFVGTIVVQGSSETDGIDVIDGNFGAAFPAGIFACHSGRDQKRCPVMLSSWKDIAAGLGK